MEVEHYIAWCDSGGMTHTGVIARSMEHLAKSVMPYFSED